MLIVKGIVLFLFIPIVLYLFLVFPFGVIPSLIVGVSLMLGHKFIARPFMKNNLKKRCVWSGKLIKTKPESFKLIDGKEEITLCTYNQKKKDLALRFFNFLYKFRYIFKPAILVTLAWYLISAFLSGLSKKLEYLPLVSNNNQDFSLAQIFKIIIALTVVCGSFLYKSGKISEPARSTFPVHNLFLLGIYWILWVFRIVGSWWIIQFILIAFK